MSEVVEAIPLADIGATAVLVVVVWLILAGRLVPRSTLEDVRADRDARLAEAHQWREAWKERGEVVRDLMRQNSRLIEVGETSAHVLTSLPREGGDEHAPAVEEA